MLKFIAGLLLIPVCWAGLETFFLLFQREAGSGAFYRNPEFFFFSAGTLIWLLIFAAARRNRLLMWLYVAGHELTHALFALICRGQVSKIHITADGGHILTNRNNFLITLSPYIFPFYTALTIAVWGILAWRFVQFADTDYFWLYGLIGFTWMFHATYTVWMLRQRQTDVEWNGRLFSFNVILLVNLLVISSFIILASPEATFGAFVRSWFGNIWTFGDRLRESVGEILRFLGL